ncbi:MAG: sugar ABC transporter permease [Desulfobacterales bacterium]|nr:sugar ABC transporter permease [Desulfobacterales bacterium]
MLRQDIKRMLTKNWMDNKKLLSAIMITPAILYIILMVGLPLILAIFYSFSDATTGSSDFKFIGLQNFRDILEDPIFRKSLMNTFIFTFSSQIIVLILSNILAMVLAADYRGKWIVRFLILLPWTAPISLGTIGWLWMLDSIFSPFDWILRYMGLLGTQNALLGNMSNMYWLGEPVYAMASVILVHIWRILPLSTVILMAGLSSIPHDLMEAASIDGAGFFRTFFKIKIPLLIPIMSISLLFGFVFTFTDMTVVYVLTRGGPIHSTQVLSSWAFLKGIEAGDLAHGAAIALFLLPLLACVVILILKLARRTEVT